MYFYFYRHILSSYLLLLTKGVTTLNTTIEILKCTYQTQRDQEFSVSRFNREVREVEVVLQSESYSASLSGPSGEATPHSPLYPRSWGHGWRLIGRGMSCNGSYRRGGGVFSSTVSDVAGVTTSGSWGSRLFWPPVSVR